MRTVLALLLIGPAASADQVLPVAAGDSIEVASIAARGPLAFQSAISLRTHAGCSRGYSNTDTRGTVALTVGGDEKVRLVVDTHSIHSHGSVHSDPATGKLTHTGGTDASDEHQAWSGRARRRSDRLVLELSRDGAPQPAPFANQIRVECRPSDVRLEDDKDAAPPHRLLRCAFDQLKDPSDPLVQLNVEGGVALGGGRGIELRAESRYNPTHVAVMRRSPPPNGGPMSPPPGPESPRNVGL